MEPEEISVVLCRASELHSKFIDAISHVSHSSLTPLFSSSSSVSSAASFSFPFSSSSAASIPLSKDLNQNGYAAGNSELQSLVSIRDALHVLEQQLESLRVLQLQQRTERDASLAEIEESRRNFLKQLKDYRGREIEIIHEALTFAGGNVTENEELIVPSGYQIINDANEVSDSQYITRPAQEQIIEDNADDQDNAYECISRPIQEQIIEDNGEQNNFEEQGNVDEEENVDEQHLHRNQDAFDLYIEGQEEDGIEIISLLNRNNDKDSTNSLVKATLARSNGFKKSMKHLRAFRFAVNSVKSSVTFLGQVIGRITGHIIWPSSKVVLILLSTIVLLSLIDQNEEKKKKKTVFRVPRTTSYGSHHHYLRISENSSSKVNEEEDEDYFPKCIVRERIELPFYRELQGPDVLYGRG